MRATRADAYRLWHAGQLTLARCERNGIAVDMDYLTSQVKKLKQDIKDAEEELQSDEIWRTWCACFKEPKLGSSDQLSHVIFKKLGYQQTGNKTEKGDDAADEAAFRHIDLPFLKRYFHLKKLNKVSGTYFDGMLREVCDGLIHPSFNLHTARSYRSSGSSPNLQNVPSRVDWIMQMIRRCFVPRNGGRKRSHRRCLVEVDSTAFEVKISYTYHQDPTMRAYLLDPNSDMHGDTAEELFLLPKGFVKQNAEWAKKTVRDWAKNRFVFAQFYGDVYYQRAPHIWEAVTERGRDGSYTYKMPDGQPIYEYLASRGIKELGRCLPTVPAMPGTYEHLVKRVERSFWEDRFPVYTQWKKRFHEEYLRNGYFDLHTGFRCEGVFKRNQVLCIPTQGAAFHVLLKAMILLQDYIDRYDLDALLVAEIHDSIIADVAEDDLGDYLTAARHILTRTVPSLWKWINIDLGVEAEVCPVGESWDRKAVWVENGGVWAPKPKKKQ